MTERVSVRKLGFCQGLMRYKQHNVKESNLLLLLSQQPDELTQWRSSVKRPDGSALTVCTGACTVTLTKVCLPKDAPHEVCVFSQIMLVTITKSP